jgi:hypothetical protein
MVSTVASLANAVVANSCTVAVSKTDSSECFSGSALAEVAFCKVVVAGEQRTASKTASVERTKCHPFGPRTSKRA